MLLLVGAKARIETVLNDKLCTFNKQENNYITNIIVRWLEGKVRDILWEVMPLCISGLKFTQAYENER